MKKKETTPKTREQLFAEKASKSYAICHSQSCPMRSSCLRWQLQDYTPKDRRINACVNLNNPAMQTDTCPMYRNDQPVRMPLGISKIYYDMPQRIAHPLKQHLIYYFNRKRYYEYHSGYKPVPPEHEQYIRQAVIRYGWQQSIEFNAYVEEHLW
jgi:hypothetical protein